MSKVKLLESVPVNLIQQPLERAAIAIWLIAFAQFFTYAPGPSATPALSWFLTAPVLMIASMVIAIRSNNSLPLLGTFFSGAVAILVYFNPEMSSVVSWLGTLNSDYLPVNPHEGHRSLMILGLYSLIFWLITSRFLQSRFYIFLRQFVDSNNLESEFYQKFERFIFAMIFVVLNTVVIFSLTQPDYFSIISLCTAIVFLFVSGMHITEGQRGVLLPLYMTLLLVSSLLIQSDTKILFVAINTSSHALNSDLIYFVIWSFILWFGDNFVSQYYNRIFTNLKITTVLWPLFGLVLLAAFLFKGSLALIVQPLYLVLLIAYLFLMLRNTSMSFISWSMILLLSWLMLVIEFPVNSDLFSSGNLSNGVLYDLGHYGQQSLLFCFSLILFSLLWDRYLNPMLSHLGWCKISFKKPVLTVSFVVTILWFSINIVLVTGLLTGWFDLINQGLAIEMTTILVIVSFIIMSFFMNNQLLANLIHSSLIFMMIVLWGGNKAIPVYTLFAIIHIVWVLLPSLTRYVCLQFKLTPPRHFINAAKNWVVVSFIVTVFYLLYFADNYFLGIETFSFLSGVAILFVASLISARRSANALWTVSSYLLAAAVLLSLRFIILGNVPVNAYDTAGILFVSLILFILNRWGILASPSKKTEMSYDVLVKMLPLTALFTIPWETASLHSSLTLLLLGLFYLAIEKGNRKFLYTGFVLINLAVYMWMPLLSNYTSLLMFYVLPVSFSLLFVSHLHRNEITSELQNKIRFIALSLLYLVATADIFISSSLLLLFVGLLLGLASTVYGISSKTRAFLYTGVGFIIINILGQLIVFYPEERLGRALILMTTGAVITGLMVWFNIKREFLLSKIRLFRADLDQWD